MLWEQSHEFTTVRTAINAQMHGEALGGREFKKREPAREGMVV